MKAAQQPRQHVQALGGAARKRSDSPLILLLESVGSDAQQLLSPLIYSCGFFMVVVRDAAEIATYLEYGKEIAAILDGVGDGAVARALLTCERMPPLIRLLKDPMELLIGAKTSHHAAQPGTLRLSEALTIE
eukprot:3506289-Prymnesium_polylepis.1